MRLVIQADEALMVIPSDAFTEPVVRDKTASAVFGRGGPDLTNPLLLLGEKPFETAEFSGFLRKWRLKPYVFLQVEDLFEAAAGEDWSSIADYKPPIVILGHRKWLSRGLVSLLADERITARPLRPEIPYEFTTCWIEKDVIDGEVVFRRSPDCRKLTFCSQESFLRCLFERRPFTETLPLRNAETLHAALAGVERLRAELKRTAETFPWPSTVAALGAGQIKEDNWPQVGLLSHVGYHVGSLSQGREARRRTLEAVMAQETLPNVGDLDYLEQWGAAHSMKRLKKMAESIAAFCRNAKRRQNGRFEFAIDDWIEDLAWLKQKYYDGQFDNRFQWPRA